MIKYNPKVSNSETSIFAVMSALSNECKAINLGQGFPNFDCAPKLKDLINHHIQAGKNQYCPMPGLFELREVLSHKINDLYNQSFDPKSEITITAGATQALFTAINAFISKGDEVIIFEPAYDSYKPSVEIAGGTIVPITLSAPDYKIDWELVKDSINDKTKMIILNTPQNPIGKVMCEDEMKMLASVLEGTNIILLSDEVYEHLTYDDEKHLSALKYPELRQRTIAVYSFGKTFHSTGWKMGYCVGEAHLMKEFRNIHQWNVYSVNSFLQYALTDYLKEPKHYLELSKFYQRKRDFFNQKMAGSKLKVIPSKGTYFQLLDYSAISVAPDREFANWMCKNHGVASIPLSPFYSKGSKDKVVRLCFAKTEDVLEEAALKLKSI